MGWSGIWNIKYNGDDKEKFIDLAKMIIPNFRKRFEVLENGDEIEAIKGINWYTADRDISKIMGFLGKNDSIEVMIDGETHPYDENDNELPFEKQVYSKENGKVIMQSDYGDEYRYVDDELGMKFAIRYQIENRENPGVAALDGYTDTTYTYASWIANELCKYNDDGILLGIKDNLVSAYKQFIEEICDFELPENMDEDGIRQYEEFKKGMKSLTLLREYRTFNNYDKREQLKDLPDCLKGMDKRDIKKLGGVETLVELFEKSGEQKTIELLSIMGYSLNATKGTKKKSHFKEIEEKIAADTKIKQSINDYLISIIKKKYPSLSKENEEKFLENISGTIDNEMQSRFGFSGGFGPRGLHCDNRPSPELEYAFMSMDFGPDWNRDRMSAAAHLTFPHKMSIYIESGRYAKATDGYCETKYLYMSEEYKAQALYSVNKRIESELAKIPETQLNEFEQEYKKELEKYEVERKPLLERKRIEDDLNQQETQLREKSDKLIGIYARRIDEIDSLNISESEKQQKKNQILEDTKAVLEEYNNICDINYTKKAKMKEEFGWLTLEGYDEENKSLQDKEQWMRDRVIRYAREENNKVWEEFRSTPHEPFTWPETDHLPTSDLYRYYAERDTIESYQETPSIAKEEAQTQTLTDSQREIAIGFANAYSDYVSSKYKSWDYLEKDKNNHELNRALQEYFVQHINRTQDIDFMKEFENEGLSRIAEQYNFHKERDYIFGRFNRKEETDVKFEDGILVSDIWSKKVYYGDRQSVDEKISELKSKKRFYEDCKDNEYSGLTIDDIRFLKSLEEYKNERFRQKTLAELDKEKAILEDKEKKAKDLLEQYQHQYGNDIIQQPNAEAISIED